MGFLNFVSSMLPYGMNNASNVIMGACKVIHMKLNREEVLQ